MQRLDNKPTHCQNAKDGRKKNRIWENRLNWGPNRSFCTIWIIWHVDFLLLSSSSSSTSSLFIVLNAISNHIFELTNERATVQTNNEQNCSFDRCSISSIKSKTCIGRVFISRVCPRVKTNATSVKLQQIGGQSGWMYSTCNQLLRNAYLSSVTIDAAEPRKKKHSGQLCMMLLSVLVNVR